MKMEWRGHGDEASREMSWLDWSLSRDVSPDGKWVLFDETGMAGGGASSVYMRAVDGSPAVRLGDGLAHEFSPDGRWALATDQEHGRLVLLPTRAGEMQVIPLPDLGVGHATWFPDGKAICLSASEPGRLTRLYVYDLASKKLRPISDDGVGRIMGRISPDGKLVIATDPTGAYALYPTEGGAAEASSGASPG